jgi:hypothetical protein
VVRSKIKEYSERVDYLRLQARTPPSKSPTPAPAAAGTGSNSSPAGSGSGSSSSIGGGSGGGGGPSGGKPNKDKDQAQLEKLADTVFNRAAAEHGEGNLREAKKSYVSAAEFYLKASKACDTPADAANLKLKATMCVDLAERLQRNLDSVFGNKKPEVVAPQPAAQPLLPPSPAPQKRPQGPVDKSGEERKSRERKREGEGERERERVRKKERERERVRKEEKQTDRRKGKKETVAWRADVLVPRRCVHGSGASGAQGHVLHQQECVPALGT